MDESKPKQNKSPYSKIKSLESIIEAKDKQLESLAGEAVYSSRENTLLKQEILRLKTEIGNTRINYNNVYDKLDKIPNWIKKLFI